MERLVIRQAISCDICGAEKKQTNHWFVACEQAGELRLSGWTSRMRLRPGAKHLCGQTCLHKLVDEFMARTIDGRIASTATDPTTGTVARREVDASLTSPAAFRESAHNPKPTPQPLALESPLPRLAPETTSPAVVPFPTRQLAGPSANPPIPAQPDSPQYASRRWRAEAWERERNREARSSDRRLDLATRRRGQ